MRSPCKDCGKRSAGCATSCKEWAEYVAERNENYAKRHKWADVAGYAANKIGKRKHREQRTRRK